jgi:hypothetical protein
MPRKQGDAGLPKIKKVTKKQWEAARKAKPAKGRKVVKGGVWRWLSSDK